MATKVLKRGPNKKHLRVALLCEDTFSGPHFKVDLVKGGRSAYLWIGSELGHCLGVITDRTALRALRNALDIELRAAARKERR